MRFKGFSVSHPSEAGFARNFSGCILSNPARKSRSSKAETKTTPAPPPDDASLVRRAKRKDLLAFDELIRRYERRVIGLCFRHLQQYEEACDLAQEIFLQVFHRLKDFEGRSSFSTWLYRVSLNACYNRHRFLKARGRGGTTSLEGMLEGGPDRDGPRRGDSHAVLDDGSPGALETLEQEETRLQLRSALESLGEHHRSPVELVDIEGLSYEEAAAALDIPVNTVRSRLSRARAALKAKIARMRKRTGE